MDVKRMPANHRFGERGGITISRRPNNCPSNENAPGPNNAIPTAVITKSSATSETPSDASGGAGIHERVIPNVHPPTNTLARGVMKPIIKPAPPSSKITATAHTAAVRSTLPASSSAPTATATPPNAARRSSNPIPGLPLGNVENSLCSGTLPLAHSTNARHRRLSV